MLAASNRKTERFIFSSAQVLGNSNRSASVVSGPQGGYRAGEIHRRSRRHDATALNFGGLDGIRLCVVACSCCQDLPASSTVGFDANNIASPTRDTRRGTCTEMQLVAGLKEKPFFGIWLRRGSRKERAWARNAGG